MSIVQGSNVVRGETPDGARENVKAKKERGCLETAWGNRSVGGGGVGYKRALNFPFRLRDLKHAAAAAGVAGCVHGRIYV